MVKEEYIIKIINNEFEKILKNIDTISQADNDGFSKNKIFFMKLYKNIEITKSNILLNIKKYFDNNKFTNIQTNDIYQLTKILHSKNRNKSHNKIKIQPNINMNNRKLFNSIIDNSSTDLKNNNSYLSPSSNKKVIKMKPLIIDARNGRNSINNNSNNTVTYFNNLNNINTNNSNIINNPYNINNIISDEEREQDKKMLFYKKSNLIKKHFNYLLNKSNSELKLGLKDKKNSFSSNKVYHQKKKISLVNDILKNMSIFNKSKNKKNLKLFINTVNVEGNSEKVAPFPFNQNKNGASNFYKTKKKLTMNKINIQKLHFNNKTEVINKKRKIINISSNKYVKKNKNFINKIVNKSFKRNDNKLNRISQSVNINNMCNNINNSLSYNAIDNDDSINDKIIDLAKEIIYFLDNFKNLQNTIIKKDVDTKKMKLNFEMQKLSLYQKAKKILNNSYIYNSNNNNNNNNCNESKSNISNNSKGLISTTVKSDSISYIKNYFGNNKNNQSGIGIKNNNDINSKELNLSIVNLKKTIEDMKLNDEIICEQLKNEIKDLNNKINEKEKIIKNLNSENLEKIINIYKTLLNYSNNKNHLICKVPSDKKFDWYIYQINEIIEMSGKEWKKINDISSNNKTDKVNEQIIKEELYKATIDIINWLQPYIQLNNGNDIKSYISQLEEEFQNYGIKQALNSLKSKIKELIYLLEVNNGNNNNNGNNIIEKDKFIKLNSIILNIQNNLKEKIDKKNKEILSIKNDLKNALSLNNKILNILNNYFPQETRIFQEKYDYILSLYNEEQNKVNVLQSEFLNMIDGLIDYIENGNKIYIELGKMWNIKPKKETNFELVEPESDDMGHLSESDLLSNGSKKIQETNLEVEKYKKELEEYKITFKYLENKMNKYENLLKNIVEVLIKIIKNMKMNEKQKELFFTLFRMLNIKDEKIISFINSD